MKKNKTLITFMIILSSILFVSTITAFSLLYFKNKENISVKEELNYYKNEYSLTKESKNSLDEDFNILQIDYNKLLAKSKILPKQPEDFVKIALKLGEANKMIALQITYINYLKTKNSYSKSLTNLNDYIGNVTNEYKETFAKYWEESLDLEYDTRINFSNLDRKLSTG